MEQESLRERVIPRTFRPRFVVWELTLACNLRCGHCGSRAGKGRPNELSTSECVDLVFQLADLECALLTLSGGEPTLRPDWLTIARAAMSRGILVNVVSNGLAMSLDMALQVKDSGLANVGLSLDGLADTHEALRGRETFGKLAQAVRNLNRAKVPVSIMTTLNRHTAVELEKIHDLAVDMGAAAWRVQLGKPMGNLADNDELVIPPEALLDVVPRLARIKKESPIWVDVGDSIGYYGPHERLLRKTRWPNMGNWWAGCQAGRRALGIESDGGIKGCLSLQASLEECVGGDPFREGDIRTRSLADIWFDPHSFAFSRWQAAEDLSGECRTCRYARRCRGGAKCVAAAFTGRLGEDPYCYHRMSALAAAASGRENAARRQERSAFSRAATAAAMTVGMGLSGVCLGGCMERAIGNADLEREGADAGLYEPDAEPPVAEDYGVIPYDASFEHDAEPPISEDYGVFPYDASIEPVDGGEADAEPPGQLDYGVFPVDGGAEEDGEVVVTPDYGDIPPEPEIEP
jgi:radical SAM protein with 4Fe4S-binding SPASM domain